MNFIFDFDGTLLNTKLCMLKALEWTFQEFEIELESSDIMEKYVRDPLSLFKIEKIKHFNDKQLSDFLESYRLRYLTLRKQKALLFPDVQTVLKALKVTGSKLFLISNASHEETINKVNLLQIGHYFDEILGSDTLRIFKPHPYPIEYLLEKYHLSKISCYMVGDSINDIKMAHAAGIESVAMLSGINSRYELEIENPKYILESLTELIYLS